jgi:hypothetical protein
MWMVNPWESSACACKEIEGERRRITWPIWLGACEVYIAGMLGSNGYVRCGWISCLVVYLPMYFLCGCRSTKKVASQGMARGDVGSISVRIATKKNKFDGVECRWAYDCKT